jgi:hypothetical protein
VIDLGFEQIENGTARIDSTSLTVLLRNLIDNPFATLSSGARIEMSPCFVEVTRGRPRNRVGIQCARKLVIFWFALCASISFRGFKPN